MNGSNKLSSPKEEKVEEVPMKVGRKRRACRRKCDLCAAMAYPYTSSLSVVHVKTIDFILGSNLLNCLVAKKRVYFCSSHVEDEFERETVKRYGQRRTVGEVSYILGLERANQESLQRLLNDMSMPFRVCTLCSVQTCSYTTINSWKTAKTIDFILGTHLFSLISYYHISICRSHMEDFEREIVKRYGKRRTIEDVQKMLGIGFVDNSDPVYPAEATPTRVFDEKKVKEEEREEVRKKCMKEVPVETICFASDTNCAFSPIGASSMEVFDTPIVEPLNMVKEEGIEDLRMMKLEENQSVDKQLSLNRLKEEEKVDVTHLLK